MWGSFRSGGSIRSVLRGKQKSFSNISGGHLDSLGSAGSIGRFPRVKHEYIFLNLTKNIWVHACPFGPFPWILGVKKNLTAS